MTKYWVIAPYDSTKTKAFEHAWKYDLEHGIIAIGWLRLGDVSGLSADELRQKIKETYPDKSDRGRSIDFSALWKFFHEIEVGDKIIARRGRKVMLAVGTVTRTAYYDKEKGIARVGSYDDYYYPNFIDVEWEENYVEFDWIAFSMHTLAGPFDDEYYYARVENTPPPELELPEEGGESFMFESHLEDFIVTNFDRIFGLDYEIFVDEDGVQGKQYPVTNGSERIVGRVDILARCLRDDSFYIIELKRDYGIQRAVRQTLWYMGWMKTNPCRNTQGVRGLTICAERNERLEYALEMARDLIDVKSHSIHFTFEETKLK